MSELANRICDPSQTGDAPLKGAALEGLHAKLGGDWQVIEAHHLQKNYAFSNFAEALAFVNQVGALAEEIGHHPDIYFTWGKARIEILTHSLDGLSEPDFILAAKIDALPAAS